MTELISPSLSSGWFSYAIRVYPHHTDYAGIVWHGSYITWMEEARVEYLRSAGVSFDQLVAAGVDLPVVDLTLRYHQAAKMGEELLIMTKFSKSQKLRLTFDYEIKAVDPTNPEGDRLCVTASVSLVPVDSQKRKILRSLPSLLDQAIAGLLG
ncbi:acyl-CoA thioester hydrolase, YbgC/YbaW family [Synechococcus sp. PCC 7502]|uniref:acyl-CoA thioesterase n=1 Tax=Synechococcus sp. PCC 7502 TaxID=1173263 RepID=UPI00029FFD14|nr:thioesterase family protein [Synechococcus sp. PCC 7502]AFY75236.1 acyl-CoA thioester hydrolase, YbgC/YbaW family [Synechococcus sp. PCC 7502]